MCFIPIGNAADQSRGRLLGEGVGSNVVKHVAREAFQVGRLKLREAGKIQAQAFAFVQECMKLRVNVCQSSNQRAILLAKD